MRRPRARWARARWARARWARAMWTRRVAGRPGAPPSVVVGTPRSRHRRCAEQAAAAWKRVCAQRRGRGGAGGCQCIPRTRAGPGCSAGRRRPGCRACWRREGAGRHVPARRVGAAARGPGASSRRGARGRASRVFPRLPTRAVRSDSACILPRAHLPERSAASSSASPGREASSGKRRQSWACLAAPFEIVAAASSRAPTLATPGP